MHHLTESQRAKLAELCRRYNVVRLEIFGSMARGDFNSRSDIDLLVQFQNTRTPGYADRYMDFAEALENLFGRKVDLVTARSLRNPLFIRAVESERKILYAA